MAYEKGPEKSRHTISSERYLLLNSSLLFKTEIKQNIPLTPIPICTTCPYSVLPESRCKPLSQYNYSLVSFMSVILAV